MIITPTFIFVHCPKTGGTFVARTIEELLCPNKYLRVFYKLNSKYNFKLPFFEYHYHNEQNQHAWCIDIPTELQRRDIVSIIRNPYDFYVSAYAFEWWKTDLDGLTRTGLDRYFYDVKALKLKYKNILGITFNQFLSATWEFSSWINMTLKKHPNANNLGLYTHRFVYFYCRDHDYVFEAADNHILFKNRVQETMFDVHFLRQDRLNNDLYDYLLGKGFSKEDLSFILNQKRINQSKRLIDHNKYYDKSLKTLVRERDSLIFELFPEFEIF